MTVSLCDIAFILGLRILTINNSFFDAVTLLRGGGAKYCYAYLCVSLSAHISRKPRGRTLPISVHIAYVSRYLVTVSQSS